jgi:hypothetical protein
LAVFIAAGALLPRQAGEHSDARENVVFPPILRARTSAFHGTTYEIFARILCAVAIMIV